MSNYIKPPASKSCKWRKGPPPSIGWWPASVQREPAVLRWWDGKRWSMFTLSSWTAKQAGDHGGIYAITGADIEWCDRWWEPKAQGAQEGV